MAKLFRVILPVTDIELAVGFYAKVLSQEGQRVSPGRHYFDCEGVVLACYEPGADGDEHQAVPLSEPVYLAVDNLQDIFQRASDAGAKFSSDNIPGVGPIGEIARRPWGEESFYANDPFDNPLCFVSRESVFSG